MAEVKILDHQRVPCTGTVPGIEQGRMDAVSAGDQQGYVPTVPHCNQGTWRRASPTVYGGDGHETGNGFCPVVPQHIWWRWRRTVECNGLLWLLKVSIAQSDVVSQKWSLSEAAGSKFYDIVS
ncbi:unnamed protein product [Fusarium graminearum]|uniref:Chromosome 2, complete genome n=1 Tax=Gibberella zeae (strain ATCC MYA-4620 / CBS 123657 / FGSC 9075 / NRRL 31084 / PH-1) TaxID=229533 RepID=I1S5Y7_GIBZE|nr:hypothetical protein FGSG_12258 [Fusarium graminearum PH-1]ESU08678.1 hypothetical protein FGSG_12258 [Fusarium graminearum PH-1]CEF79432.1 unnamed protein product [Fusarium graminearum]CZS82718.1 unnamed protein product [Fusarium graminearum]|eukprot:XP_011321177.1 hypothetical protein FGSG_12258 [Fusarium graminearum PH-1]